MLHIFSRKSSKPHDHTPLQQQNAQQQLIEKFVDLLSKKNWDDAEMTFRNILATDPTDSLQESVSGNLKQGIEIENISLLRKLYGADFIKRAHRHLKRESYEQLVQKKKTDRDPEELVTILRRDTQNHQVLAELLTLWDLHPSDKQKLSEKLVLTIANTEIHELFFGINIKQNISKSNIWKAIQLLCRERNNEKPLSYLCDFLIAKGFKNDSKEYRWEIHDTFDTILTRYPYVENFKVLHQKLGITITETEKIDLSHLMNSSRKIKDFGLVTYLLEHDIHLFTKCKNYWMSNINTYCIPKIFLYFPQWIDLCSEAWKKSRRDTEEELWENILSAGNMETIHIFAPQLKEPTKYRKFIGNYQTLQFLIDSKNHPLEIVWSEITTTDSHVLLWLANNNHKSISMKDPKRHFDEHYSTLICVPHAIKHSNFQFFDKLEIPISKVLNHHLQVLGTGDFPKIPLCRWTALFAIMEHQKEDFEFLINDMIFREDFDELLTYLTEKPMPKINVKHEHLFKAIEKKIPKCALVLFMYFKDNMPDKIHQRQIYDPKGINDLCKKFNLDFRYKKDDYNLVKIKEIDSTKTN